ncbi:hypothetical protein CHS0354_023705 [Potamilus streckersoni]|uniref:Cysteine--tRNA ligase, cytoplasmic n=1 Tax=Potamilus streckersoni TaxID=2493646 RepID=A0AAE0RYP6_9BIVA|nr:hypothetical protein CHS0354_023705 [Potamilus streckersoni]
MPEIQSHLILFNTLTHRKEVFVPKVAGHVSIYVCGPTVYGHSHIGHAKSYVSFDCIVRWFKKLGYRVTYVQNITDVGHLTDDTDIGEDKVQKKARVEQIHPMEIAQHYTQSFYEDMDALHVQRPNIAPTASGHITEQIALIIKLIEKGHAYESNGSVYFSVASFPKYGRLSGRTEQTELEAGHRIHTYEGKRHPSDFALWKKAELNHIMNWDSPWSIGFPGWHIECSAMSMKYLGTNFDIHGGGLENQFPHHECEIAQSESATETAFANYWLHNNMVTVNGVKMGKSLGNFTTIKDILKSFSPTVLRFFILQSHYRSTLDFSHEALSAAKTGLQKLYETYERVKTSTPTQSDTNIDILHFQNDFHKAMNDDFNTPFAIASLFDFSKYVNTILDRNSISEQAKHAILSFFEEYAWNILAILNPSQEKVETANVSALMPLILSLRDAARAKKDFATSDFIRDNLISIGIQIQDGKNGTTWKIIK